MQHISLLFKRKTMLTIYLLLVLSITLVSNVSMLVVYAQTNIYMQPSENIFELPTTQIGYKWNITFYVQNVNDLFAYQVALYYEQTVINTTNAWIPTWDAGWVFTNKTTVKLSPVIKSNETHNQVWVGDTILGGTTFTGSGKLAIIEFQIISAPPKRGTLSTALNINNIYTYLLNSQLKKIPTAKVDGSVTYTWIPPSEIPHLAVDPNNVTLGQLDDVVGENFTIGVYIVNLDPLWYLHNVTFSLSFNATIIDEIANTTSPFWATHSVNATTDGSLKRVDVFVGDPVANPNGTVLLITMQFNVTHQGIYPAVDESELTLSNITLNNTQEVINTTQPIHGNVKIIGLLMPSLRVEPSLYEAQKKDETFSINITLNSLTEDLQLVYFRFKLLYNATLLELLNVVEGPFLAEFGDTVFNYTNGAGNVVVENGISSFGSFPQGNGTVATVTFRVAYRGFYPEENNCTLSLVDVVLLDINQGELPWSSEDGFYEIVSYRLPVAGFTFSPGVVNATVPVLFDASESFDPFPGAVSSYMWDFGDGTGVTVPVSTVNHTFAVSGVFNVTLTVTDDDGLNGSVTVSVLVARLGGVVSVAVSRSTVVFGEQVVVSGAVFPVREGVNVTVNYMLEGLAEWRLLGVALTDGNGSFSLVWRPPHAGVYRVGAVWLGDLVVGSAQGEVVLTVGVAPSTVSASVYPDVVVVESDVTISGAVKPIRANGSVSLFIRIVGEEWRELGTAKTDSLGHYSYTWEITEMGTFEVKAIWKGDADTLQSESSSITLEVRARSTGTLFYMMAAVSIIAAIMTASLYYRRKTKKIPLSETEEKTIS